MDYRSIIDGSRKDLPAIFLRVTLRPAACIYGLAVRLRNRRFDRKTPPPHDAGVPVISVGNITAGGTGKTPLVAAIAKHLRVRGLRVALVSRGYGSDETGLNDEARELYHRLPDVPHIQNPDRIEACRIAVDELEMQAIILDDGFQHRRLNRDLDIVLIDATCPFGYGHLLPRGLLREPVGNLRRADLVVLSRASRLSTEARQSLLAHIRKLAPTAAVAQCDHLPTGLISVDSQQSIDFLKGKRVAAFAGIGNPQPFFDSLSTLGAIVVAAKPLPDHCRYDRKTVQQLSHWLDSQRSSIQDLIAVCTHKDLVKLRTPALASVPLWALTIEMQLQSGNDLFWEAIDRTAPRYE